MQARKKEPLRADNGICPSRQSVFLGALGSSELSRCQNRAPLQWPIHATIITFTGEKEVLQYRRYNHWGPTIPSAGDATTPPRERIILSDATGRRDHRLPAISSCPFGCRPVSGTGARRAENAKWDIFPPLRHPHSLKSILSSASFLFTNPLSYALFLHATPSNYPLPSGLQCTGQKTRARARVEKLSHRFLYTVRNLNGSAN